MDRLLRREFITLLGGATVAWPLAARAQQGERMRRIGMLIPLNADAKVAQDRIAVFVQGLKELGWIEGRNVQFDIRLGAGVATTLKQATEMVALAPEVILANGSAAMGSLSFPIRSEPATSQAWRGQAAMPPGSRVTNTA